MLFFRDKLGTIIKEIIQGSFFHLLVIFTILVVLLKFKFVNEFVFNFVLLALVLGLFGFSLKKGKKVEVPVWLFYIAIGFSLFVRIIPYLWNKVPLGYDPGFYKYLFENPFSGEWIKQGYPLLFSIVMNILERVFGSWFLLIPFFVILSTLTIVVLFFVVRKLFGKNVAVISSLLFMISIAQFQTFWWNYYKNVIGIMLLLISFLYFDEKFNWKLVLIGGLIAGFHRPAFFIFGLTYLVYVFSGKRKNYIFGITNGLMIIILAVLFNIDRVFTYLVPGLIYSVKGIVELGGGAGTFFDVGTYFYYSIALVPFAIIGFIHNFKRNKQLSIAFIITTLVVLLGLFFHNRFIIYLDIFVIIYAALGFYSLIQNKELYGKIITFGFIILFGYFMLVHAFDSKPLISSEEFEEIKGISVDGSILVTDGSYSPWLKGYTDNLIIAPGLFEENKMDLNEWRLFWSGENQETFLNRYSQPLYVHVGERQNQLVLGNCFELIFNGKTKLYKFVCVK